MSRIRIDDLSRVAPLSQAQMQRTGGGMFGGFGFPFLFGPFWRRRFVRPVIFRPRFRPVVFGPSFGFWWF